MEGLFIVAAAAAAVWVAREVFAQARDGVKRQGQLGEVYKEIVLGRVVEFQALDPPDLAGAGTVVAQLHVNLPTDVVVVIGQLEPGYSRAAFEEALMVRGLRQDRVIRALHHPSVDEAIRTLTALDAAIHIDKRRILIDLDDPKHPHLLVLEWVAKLAHAFDHAWRLPWEDARETLGLEWKGADLIGVIDDVPIRASEIPTPTGWRIEIAAELHPPLAQGFLIRRGSGGMDTGDMMLDAALRVQSSTPEQTREMLNRPGVREPLLELIHGHPASRVSTDGIDFRSDRWLSGEELVLHIRMAVTLALGLRP